MKPLNSVFLPLQKETKPPNECPQLIFPTSKSPSPYLLINSCSRVSSLLSSCLSFPHQMMSSENKAAKPANKEESQSSGNRKSSSTRPQEQELKCPRCDSPNTKFCYYNNYSLTQPRHFCKTCRRYWTKGGALRNVPIGGGCRKNKKIKSSSRLSGDSKDSGGSSDIGGGLNFFHSLSPAMDFQLGGLTFPRLHPPTTPADTQFSSFGNISTASSAAISPNSCFGLDPSVSSGSLLGFNFHLSSMLEQGQTSGSSVAAAQDMSPVNVQSSLASSIESLSSINQDLHRKLQQQRLAMLYGPQNQKENTVSSLPIENIQAQKPQPILFQNLEIFKPEVCPAIGTSGKDGGSRSLATEWFFDSSFGPVNPPPPTNSSSSGNDNASNWNGIQAWSDLNQYSSLP